MKFVQKNWIQRALEGKLFFNKIEETTHLQCIAKPFLQKKKGLKSKDVFGAIEEWFYVNDMTKSYIVERKVIILQNGQLTKQN